MNRSFFIPLLVIAALAAFLNFANNSGRRGLIQRRSEAVKEQRRRVVEVLTTDNGTLTKSLSNAAHSYCNGEDLAKYPLPKYDTCPPDSILNVIPFVGGMTSGLKLALVGALMSFQEDRCFVISEDHSPLNLESGTFANDYFFEDIGLPHDDEFVTKALMDKRYEVRNRKRLLTDVMLHRIEGIKYNFNTSAYSHPEYAVDGLTLKRDFLRHMWHLRPTYRDLTCQALKDQDIFDTDYIALSIRRGDMGSKLESFKSMNEYIIEAERLVPLVFAEGQKPKFFVATDDCAVVGILRKARPEWIFKSECDQLSTMQTGYDHKNAKNMNVEEREEHFRKFFVELYALALSKVFIGVSHSNVAWWAYMMRPNVDKSTYILLDYINDPSESMHDPTRIW